MRVKRISAYTFSLSIHGTLLPPHLYALCQHLKLALEELLHCAGRQVSGRQLRDGAQKCRISDPLGESEHHPQDPQT